MKTRSWCFCCATVLLGFSIGLTVETAGAEAAKKVVNNPKTTSHRGEITRVPAVAAKKLRGQAPSKNETHEKQLASARILNRESWDARLRKYLALDGLGCRIFPLALLVQGGLAAKLFLAADEAELPDEIIRVQVSRRLVEHYFQLAIQSEDVIDDAILGAKIDGKSRLVGTIELVFRPNSKDIRFDLVFIGVSHARTQGVHSVVVLQNSTETLIRAEKSFVWNSKGLSHLPTVAIAEAHSATDQIDTALPGVLGRIATDIAAKRVAEVQPAIDAAVAETAAATVRQVLDARVEHALFWPQLVGRRLASTDLGRATRVRVGANRESFQFLLLRRDVKNTPAVTKVTPLPKDCDVSIQIHRRVLREVTHDSLLLGVGATLGAQLIAIATVSEPNGESLVSSTFVEQRPDWRIAPSPDGQSLVVRHFHALQSPAKRSKTHNPRQKVH